MKLYNQKKVKNKRRLLCKQQTEAEKSLWRNLRNKQLNGLKFYRQYSIGIYILDFYCPLFRVAIELDGSQHLEPESMVRDSRRKEFLKRLNIHVLRFWDNEVFNNKEGILEKILQHCTTPPSLPFNKGEEIKVK